MLYQLFQTYSFALLKQNKSSPNERAFEHNMDSHNLKSLLSLLQIWKVEVNHY